MQGLGSKSEDEEQERSSEVVLATISGRFSQLSKQSQNLADSKTESSELVSCGKDLMKFVVGIL